MGFHHFDIFDHFMTTVWSSVVSGLDSKRSFSDSPWSITPISGRLYPKSVEIMLVYSIFLKNRLKYRYLGFGWRKSLLEPTIGFLAPSYPRKSLVWALKAFADFQFFKGEGLTDFREVRYWAIKMRWIFIKGLNSITFTSPRFKKFLSPSILLIFSERLCKKCD